MYIHKFNIYIYFAWWFSYSSGLLTSSVDGTNVTLCWQPKHIVLVARHILPNKYTHRTKREDAMCDNATYIYDSQYRVVDVVFDKGLCGRVVRVLGSYWCQFTVWIASFQSIRNASCIYFYFTKVNTDILYRWKHFSSCIYLFAKMCASATIEWHI